MIDLTVVIPNYNGEEFLGECLDSLRGQDYSFHVIIVDNGSTDGSVDYIKNDYPDFVLIENQENKGFAAAVNQGIKASDTDYVFLLNNDVVLGSDCLSNLSNFIRGDDSIFAVASRMVRYDDHNVLDDVGDEYSLLGWTRKVGDGESVSLYNVEMEVFSACAGAALYRRRVFDCIGFFDENFFAYMEDVDIGYRARIHGYRSVYCPDAVVYHHVSGTSGDKYNSFKVRLAARNNIYVAYKNMPWPQFICNSVFLFLGFTVKYLFFLRMGLGESYLDGLGEGLSSLGTLERVSYSSDNLRNYFIIEWLLIRNTFKFILFQFNKL